MLKGDLGNLYDFLKGKEVIIVMKSFHPATEVHDGKVVGKSYTGSDLYLVLDNGKLINTKYILSIEIRD